MVVVARGTDMLQGLTLKLQLMVTCWRKAQLLQMWSMDVDGSLQSSW